MSRLSDDRIIGSSDHPVIGVLSLQGCVDRHKPHIEAAGGSFVAVKTAEQLQFVDALIIPGGESTTMLKLIDVFSMEEPLKKFFAQKPVWGICAGSILMAETVFVSSRPEQRGAEGSGQFRTSDRPDPSTTGLRPSAQDDGRGIQKSFGLLPITIERNGYGRQLDSRQETVGGYQVSFIRAPVIVSPSPSIPLPEGRGRRGEAEQGEGLEILASYEGTPVWLRSGKYMATTFHPELTLEYPSPMHRAFVDLVRASA